MFDLHIHTYYSDGVCDPETFLEHAALGDILAFTDHNYLTVPKQSSIDTSYSALCFLPGVELRLFGQPDLLWYFPECSHTQCIPEQAADFVAMLAKKETQVAMLRLMKMYSETILQQSVERYKEIYELPQERHFDNKDWIKVEYIASGIDSKTTIEGKFEGVEAERILKEVKSANSCLYEHDDSFTEIRELAYMKKNELLQFLEKKGGQVALAHPVREFHRMCKKNQAIHKSWDCFLAWLSEWRNAGLILLECCYGDIEECQKIFAPAKTAWPEFLTKVESIEFHLIPGSDLHNPHENERGLDVWRSGMSALNQDIQDRFPSWLKK